MLDKNPNVDLERITEAKEIIEKNSMNSILCYEPFVKTKFLADLISLVDIPIIYLDFDLMYSGYITAKLLPFKENVTLLRPSKEEWNSILKTVMEKISQEKCLAVIDSMNGFSNLFEGKDAGREVNGYLMLMVSMANQTQSNVLFVSMARKNDESEWVLSPTSRHIVENKKMLKALLKKVQSEFFLEILNEDNTIRNTIRLN